MESVTPMLRQYLDIKKQYPGTLLFFRLGDFYEMFNEDAIVGSKELEITLTARHKDSPNPIPMCGVPHHAAPTYIARLVRKGYRVAICEQTEQAGKGVKLVKREVVKVITPGTAIDPQLIEAKDPIYLAAVVGKDDTFAAAFLETSSGQFTATQASGSSAWQKISEEIESYGPLELLFPRSLSRLFVSGHEQVSRALAFSEDENSPADSERYDRWAPTPLDDGYFDERDAERKLKDHLGVATLSGFGFDDRSMAIAAAGACLQYAQETQRTAAGHITDIKYFEASDSMVLDQLTLGNLEIFESRGDSNKNSLFRLLDENVTSMGSRLLKQWLQRPLLKKGEIQTRLAAVTELQDSIIRESLRFLLKEVSDLERLIGRINVGTATPRDLIALRRSLEQVPKIGASLSEASSLLLQVLVENIFELPEIRDLILNAINEEPPPNLTEGGVIKTGFNSELDELRSLSASAKQTIAQFEDSERQRTAIPNLKIKFNNVFGYFIEVSKGNVGKVPDDYERRQTLTNAERYTTPQLKEWEQKVLGAEDRIVQLEIELFNGVKEAIRGETHKLQSTARALANIDVLASLAECASRLNFVCPVIHDGDEIDIRNGRHPVVEASLGDKFIPNDTLVNNSTDRLLIITGANMGGKSTFLRQVAIIQIMGQIGSFVPATMARLPIVDRVWTRVGASDDLASGRSTFMVEMTETAMILNNATPRSLIILDEIGRGTSTFDGLSIAWAVAEFLHNSPEHSAKTLFATHYHELTELAENLPGAMNYQITATEKDGDVVFLHKLQPGKASKSYGIAVAKLAGLPVSVIERAKDVLQKLEKYELAVFADERRSGLAKAAVGKAASQVSLFAITNEAAISELRDLNLDDLTPEESKSILAKLKDKVI